MTAKRGRYPGHYTLAFSRAFPFLGWFEKDKMSSCLTEYYGCPDGYERLGWDEGVTAHKGYFRFGEGSTCYGGNGGESLSSDPDQPLHDALADVSVRDGIIHLPFSPAEVAGNFYREAYVENWRSGPHSLTSMLYYLLRPVLPVGVRRHLQKFYLRNWEKISFPHWPVDCSVDNMFEQLMLLTLKAAGVERIPFIWFWPEGHSGCAIMTHDVETEMGCDLCPALMDVDDAYGIKASFQIVPEERYGVTPEFLASICRRGFEVAVHDLNHDGHLYKSRKQFLERAAKINSYGQQFNTRGFRAGVLYRKQIWYDALDFAYDMSVPNVARLDPQRGGCCTVMPFFLGHILEIPVTAIQDYTLFHILHDYSIDIWKKQIDIILKKHGLMSFIVHPDYSMTPKELAVYRQLLAYLAQMREDRGAWTSTPAEVNRWWRQRAAMRLVETREGWTIEGEGSERARLAWACEEDGHLVLTPDDSTEQQSQAMKGEVGALLRRTNQSAGTQPGSLASLGW